MLNKIGIIKSIDYDGIKEELRPLDREQRINKYWEGKLCKIQLVKLDGEKAIYQGVDLLCPSNYYRTSEDCFEATEKVLKDILKAEKHYNSLNNYFEIKYLDDEFVAFLYSSENVAVLPKKFVQIEFAKDYSMLTGNEIKRKLINNSENLPINSNENLSLKDYEKNLVKCEEELKLQEEKAKQELDAFKQEMYRKEQELREKQEQMLAEYRARIESMKDQIFMLETNILALRSYFGETFSISQLFKGKNAPDDTPLILFQKFRYMDEDLARLSANSEFSTDKINIEELFKNYGKLFIETFCPNDKCITFFKTSRDNRKLKYCKDNDCINEFEYYHGNQLGMLIKNGENFYISFIDEEIKLQDNLFISKSSTNSEKPVELGKSKLRDPEVINVFNRKHLFIILQALIKNTNIFNSLKSEDIFNSKNIIFSNADGQIESSKYPSFKEFFYENSGRYYDKIKEGDFIFIDEHHAGSKMENNYWGYGYHEQHRGVGYRNTGRDASIEMGISKISMINKQSNGYFVEFIENGVTYKKHIYNLDDELVKMGNKYYPKIEVEYYTSCKRDIPDWQKTIRWDGTYAKVNNANLRLWQDEFMSIMWCNSNYVQQWIDHKDSGNGKNYIYFIKQLKELREFLLQREYEEFNLINKFHNIENNPENKDLVLNWKIKNNIRNITEFQAKRFVKWYKEKNI